MATASHPDEIAGSSDSDAYLSAEEDSLVVVKANEKSTLRGRCVVNFRSTAFCSGVKKIKCMWIFQLVTYFAHISSPRACLACVRLQ